MGCPPDTCPRPLRSHRHAVPDPDLTPTSRRDAVDGHRPREGAAKSREGEDAGKEAGNAGMSGRPRQSKRTPGCYHRDLGTCQHINPDSAPVRALGNTVCQSRGPRNILSSPGGGRGGGAGTGRRSPGKPEALLELEAKLVLFPPPGAEATRRRSSSFCYCCRAAGCW